MAEDAAARWKRVDNILDDALDRPVAERTAFIASACGDDAELRAEVEALVRACAPGFAFLDMNAADFAAPLLTGYDTAAPQAAEAAPQHIGPFRVLRHIGRGGMGDVYLGERDDPELRQRVALKVVRHGMESTHAIRRFVGERRILAALEHPAIARLFDGGVRPDGAPWFAMEYVEGVPIDQHCDERRLGIRQRLELFRDVAEAVRYAHRSMVIHRDLKPGNVLVTAEGRVKLLDFGIAKLLHAEPDGSATLTSLGLRALTPEYAAPEQLRGDAVTAATDVYALGAMLYRLLCGQRPYELPAGSAADIERVICETVPAPPSSRVEDNEVALARSSRPLRLRRRLLGDLDCIVLRALRKEASHRYATVDALIDDIDRHIAGRPVLARQGNRVYHAARFARRHRAALGVASVVVLSLVLGAAGIARESRATAREAQRTERVQEFLVDLFRASDPERARGQEVTARELLDRGRDRVEAELAAEPALSAELLAVLGSIHLNLGELETAALSIRRALELRRELHGRRSPEVAASLQQLGRLFYEQGLYDSAAVALREALALQRSLRGSSVSQIPTMHNLAAALRVSGAHAEAEQLYRTAIDIGLRAAGEQDGNAADAYDGLGVVLWQTGSYEESEASHRTALGIRQRLYDEDHPDVITSLMNLSTTLGAAGQWQEAERLLRIVVERRRRLYPDGHSHLAVALDNLAVDLSKRGADEEAIALFHESIAMRRRLLGPRHADVAAAINNLAVLHYRRGALDVASHSLAEVLDIWRETFGTNHPNVATALNNLGAILSERGEYAAAEPLLRESLALRESLLGGDHPEIAQSLRNIGVLSHRLGRLPVAEAELSRALAIYRDRLPPGHPRHAEALIAYGAVLTSTSRAAEAEPLLREALAIRRSVLPDDHWQIAEAESALGAALSELLRDDEAAEMLDRGHTGLRRGRGSQSVLPQLALQSLTRHQDRLRR